MNKYMIFVDTTKQSTLSNNLATPTRIIQKSIIQSMITISIMVTKFDCGPEEIREKRHLAG